ncbi:MAG TPA: hypothetical protein VEX13_11325 [Chloroflexia bacterium]|nr:hypothetical protein [Chloroflexia bacterium]
MDQNQPPAGSAPERPQDEQPAAGQPPTQPQSDLPYGGQPTQPVGDYVPPQQGYQPQPPTGYQQPEYQPQGYAPQGAPPPGYVPPGGAPPPVYPPPGQAMPPAKKGGMPVWGWIVIGVVVFLCLGCTLLSFLLPSMLGRAVTTSITEDLQGLAPSVTASFFYSSLEGHSYDFAQTQLSSKIQGQWSADELREKWVALEDGGTITSEIVDASATETDGRVKMKLTSSNGKTYNVDLDLEFVDDTWEITGASPSLIPNP